MATSLPLKVSRSVRLLSQHGMNALVPQFKHGKYFAPLISSKKSSCLRKQSIINGTFGSFDNTTGGWDPKWDIPKKFHFLKPFKGHLRERNRNNRAIAITKAMEIMPDKIKKMRDDINARKPKKDFSFMLKRIATLSKPLSQKPTGVVKKDNNSNNKSNKDSTAAKKKK